MVFTLGFGVAKLPAVSVMSSRFYFEHRLRFCLALFAGTMLVITLGVAAFSSSPGLQVLCVFVSCFFSSWVYGGLVTYVEGR